MKTGDDLGVEMGGRVGGFVGLWHANCYCIGDILSVLRIRKQCRIIVILQIDQVVPFFVHLLE